MKDVPVLHPSYNRSKERPRHLIPTFLPMDYIANDLLGFQMGPLQRRQRALVCNYLMGSLLF